MKKNMKNLRTIAIVIMVMAATITLSACGGGSSSPKGNDFEKLRALWDEYEEFIDSHLKEADIITAKNGDDPYSETQYTKEVKKIEKKINDQWGKIQKKYVGTTIPTEVEGGGLTVVEPVTIVDISRSGVPTCTFKLQVDDYFVFSQYRFMAGEQDTLEIKFHDREDETFWFDLAISDKGEIFLGSDSRYGFRSEYNMFGVNKGSVLVSSSNFMIQPEEIADNKVVFRIARRTQEPPYGVAAFTYPVPSKK